MDMDDDVLSFASYQSALNIPSSARLPKLHKVSMLSDDPGSSDHLVLPCVVNNSIVASSMPGSGATSQYMDYDWAHANWIQIKKKRYPERVEGVDGTGLGLGLGLGLGFE